MPINFKAITKNLNLIIVFLILLSIGSGYYFLKPRYDHWQTLKLERTQFEQEQSSRAGVLSEIQNLLKNYEDVKTTFSTLSLALPRERDIPNLLVQLEALAVNNQVLMEEVSYEDAQETPIQNPDTVAEALPPDRHLNDVLGINGDTTPQTEPQEGYSTLNISLSLSGHYENFIRYLENLQENLRFLDVVSIQFDTEGKTDQTGQAENQGLQFNDRILTFKLQLRTYYLKQ